MLVIVPKFNIILVLTTKLRKHNLHKVKREFSIKGNERLTILTNKDRATDEVD